MEVYGCNLQDFINRCHHEINEYKINKLTNLTKDAQVSARGERARSGAGEPAAGCPGGRPTPFRGPRRAGRPWARGGRGAGPGLRLQRPCRGGRGRPSGLRSLARCRCVACLVVFTCVSPTTRDVAPVGASFAVSAAPARRSPRASAGF